MWDNYSVKIKYPLPWVSSMICAIRCSKRLLECIHNFAKNLGELSMCEIFFNTVALHKNLSVLPIDELSGVTWRNKMSFLDDNYLYHPVTNVSQNNINYEYHG